MKTISNHITQYVGKRTWKIDFRSLKNKIYTNTKIIINLGDLQLSEVMVK